MRRRSIACAAGAVTAISSRTITTRGQFNPIHTFQESMNRGEYATNSEEFRKLIENPGPFQVQYSPDYVDWYQRAYQEKVKAQKLKDTKNQRFPNGGQVPASGTTTTFKRPTQSFQRQEGESMRKEAVKAVEEGCCAHGWMDVTERQAQFPVINLERATDFHVKELVKELVVDRALSSDEVWDKALLYTALLQEREKAYPASFAYMKDVRSAVTFAPQVSEPGATEGAAPTVRVEHTDKYPTQAHLSYFVYHTQKYQLENAIDGQVFLRIHRLPDSDRLLFSQPPPKDMEGSSPLLPTEYPSLAAFLDRPENAALRRVLLFGELNFVVSLNPFLKFPFAEAVLTRPMFEVLGATAVDGPAGGGKNRGDSALQASMSQVLLARRGEQYPPLTSGNLAVIDGRARDVQRLQRGQEQDMRNFRRTQLQLLSEKDPAGYALNGGLTWNPRVVRAEIRDVTTRSVIRNIKTADRATTQYIERQAMDLHNAANSRAKVEMPETIPSYAPTIPHFLSMILSDPVLHYLVSTSPHTEKVDALRKAAHQLAKHFFALAMCYQKEEERRVAKQKWMVAAAVLDDEVVSHRALRLQEEQTRLSNHTDASSSTPSDGAAVPIETALSNVARRYEQSSVAGLPTYVPFASRPLEQHGFPTEARFDDYVRWMRAPA